MPFRSFVLVRDVQYYPKGTEGLCDRIVLKNSSETYTIGRSAKAKVILSVPKSHRTGENSKELLASLSRIHCRLKYRCKDALDDDNGEGWVLIDNKSTNGVFLNHTRIRPDAEYVLKTNDVIVLSGGGRCKVGTKKIQLSSPFRYVVHELEENAKIEGGDGAKRKQAPEVGSDYLADRNCSPSSSRGPGIVKRQRRQKHAVSNAIRSATWPLVRTIPDSAATVLMSSAATESEGKLGSSCARASAIEVNAQHAKSHKDTEKQSANSREDVLSKVNETLECPICMEFLVRAVTLPCGHTCCSSCWSSIRSSKTSSSKCPMCRAEFTSSQSAVRNVICDQLVEAVVDGDGFDPDERARWHERKADADREASSKTAGNRTPVVIDLS
eukprot:g1039.t1